MRSNRNEFITQTNKIFTTICVVVSAGEKDRGSDEVWKFRGALSFCVGFSLGTFSLKNSFADKALLNLALHSSCSRLDAR